MDGSRQSKLKLDGLSRLQAMGHSFTSLSLGWCEHKELKLSELGIDVVL
jgi:hypothetical protein